MYFHNYWGNQWQRPFLLHCIAFFPTTIFVLNTTNRRSESHTSQFNCVLILYIRLVVVYVILSMITHNLAAALPDADGRNRRFYNNRFEIATLRASFSIVISYLLLHLPYIVYTLILSFRLTNDQSYYTHSFLVSIASLSPGRNIFFRS